MAMNPMQKKARNSFILGFFIMFIIAAIVVGIMAMMIMDMKQEDEQIAQRSKDVYMLKTDIKSGETITTSDVEKVTIVTNINNEEIATPADFEVIVEDENGNEESQAQIARIDIPKGAFVTKTMLTPTEEVTTDDLRVQEYNMIVLPTDLEKEDYIDVRLMLPNGQDFIVVSKKRVLKSSSNTIFLKMSEAEIVTMSNAIVEAYQINGSLLYAVKYENPGIQKSATPNYLVNQDVVNLINKNPNIVQTAKNSIFTRYNESSELRNSIQNVIPTENDDKIEATEDGIAEQVQKQIEERARYIETLGTGADY